MKGKENEALLGVTVKSFVHGTAAWRGRGGPALQEQPMDDQTSTVRGEQPLVTGYTACNWPRLKPCASEGEHAESDDRATAVQMLVLLT